MEIFVMRALTRQKYVGNVKNEKVFLKLFS